MRSIPTPDRAPSDDIHSIYTSLFGDMTEAHEDRAVRTTARDLQRLELTLGLDSSGGGLQYPTTPVVIRGWKFDEDGNRLLDWSVG